MLGGLYAPLSSLYLLPQLLNFVLRPQARELCIVEGDRMAMSQTSAAPSACLKHARTGSPIIVAKGERVSNNPRRMPHDHQPVGLEEVFRNHAARCTNAPRHNNGPTTERAAKGKYPTEYLKLPNCGYPKKSFAKA